MTPSLLWCLHAAATWALVGLIWTIQVVHYPMFAGVGEERFKDYSREHNRRITWIVAPLMLAELVTAYLVWKHDPGFYQTAGLWMVAALWGVTGLFFAPLHGRLGTGFDAKAHSMLVSANWIRTAIWTARGVLVFFLIC